MRDGFVEKLKSAGVVIRNPVGLKNAGESNFYFDVKKVYGTPSLLQEIAVAMIEQMPKETTCVAVEGYGGLPLGTAISLIKGYNLTLVRQDPKKYGTKRWIDAYVPTRDDRILVVDDVFTTGGSLRRMFDVLTTNGGKVIGAGVVVKRGEGKLSVPLRYLLTAEDLL